MNLTLNYIKCCFQKRTYKTMETSLKPPGGDGGDAESIEEDVLNIVRLKYLTI